MSEHEATWDEAVTWAQERGWKLPCLSRLYLLPLSRTLEETAGLRCDESLWVDSDRTVGGGSYVHGNGDNWAFSGLAIAVDPDLTTTRRFVYQYEIEPA
ncbi:hypothetical protein ACFW1A_04050 [Kitasatospora sp. NPDC058965]|uniref:hypothetical protein n=1 Tax=Kitasatospora sp. NPDC058965 TaxID=3346682 RepID=UPI0036D03A0D